MDSTPTKFRRLLAAHDPDGPAEATLVLAAAAAFCGLQCNGEPMPYNEEQGWEGRSASQHRIARELGLGVDAVRRGVRELWRLGALEPDGTTGIYVRPEFLRDRWAQFHEKHAVRLDAASRRLGLRARPLLLVGLVAGQVNESGQLRLGVPLLAQRTGLKPRVVERALATARRAGAVHSWTVPGTWRLVLALGPSRIGGRRASRIGGRRDADGPESREQRVPDTGGHRESAVTPIVNRRSPRCESAGETRIHQDQHQDAAARGVLFTEAEREEILNDPSPVTDRVAYILSRAGSASEGRLAAATEIVRVHGHDAPRWLLDGGAGDFRTAMEKGPPSELHASRARARGHRLNRREPGGAA